ncbi:hypothetical protein [Caballeronia sordidicola]|uniref:hypothetical protein n=1 Tax=Caballeronia sordidicola TaxID=196367 RepID=UPI002119E0B5|nr:hypothetical protein [Caballeronia sordidicola]
MRPVISLLIAVSASIGSVCAFAQKPATLTFETHAAFFSTETDQAAPLDPQVFVQAVGTPTGRGPQGIDHVGDIRNARVGDSGALPIYNAHGKPLVMNLGEWLGARGTVTLEPRNDGSERIDVSLAGLQPGAEYSLFENHFDTHPIGFTPLDGTGQSNSFAADSYGVARVTVTAPKALTHDNAVLVVFHSDNQSHGEMRGDVGINAHHQLIARIP